VSVYQKKKKDKTSTWFFTFMYKGVRYRGRGGTTKTQALRTQEKVRTEVYNGEYELKRNIKNPTLEKFSVKFLERRKDHRSYERSKILVMHLLRRFGKRKMTAISLEDAEDYKGWRRSQGISNGTINRELACLKRMFNLAVDWGDVSLNPIQKLKREPEPEKQDRYVTREEARKLLDVASPHFKPILETAFNTGMRLNEILGLKWEQVTLYDPPKTKLANGQKVQVHGFIELEGTQTKNKRNRLVPVNEGTQ
jgi:integrase